MARFTKNGMALLVGAMALAASAGIAQAETRFAVQDAAGTTDKMVVTDTGKIGVGTNNPQAGIHIKGSVYPDNTIKVEGNEAVQGGGFFGYHTPSDGTMPKSGARLGYFLFGTTTPAGVAYHASGVQTQAEGGWTASSTPANFTFWTTPANSTTRVERFMITGAGNIGLGVHAPFQKLEVAGGVRLVTTDAKPACGGTSSRGTIWVTQGGTNTADTVEICLKDASNNYSWVKIH